MLILSFAGRAQEIINLYPGTIPNSKKSEVKETWRDNSGLFAGVAKPTLEIYLPEKENATNATVVICPGGGYSVVVDQAEGIKT